MRVLQHRHVGVGEARRDAGVRRTTVRGRRRRARGRGGAFWLAFALLGRIRVISLVPLAPVRCTRSDGRTHF